MRARVSAALVLGVAFGAAGRADDRPLDRAELDRRVVKTVYETALLGTELWNKGGKHDECFRLYQGALGVLQPLLDHRPKLAASVLAKMDRAKGMKAVDGGFVLREALDEIQNEIAPGPKPDPKEAKEPKEAKKTTLWDRLGGEAVVKKVVHDVVLAAAEDPNVNRFFQDKKYNLDVKGIPRLEQALVEFVSEATGGPLKSGKDANPLPAGTKVTEAEFDTMTGLLVKSLEKFKVAKADADELMKVVAAAKRDVVEGKGN